MTTDTKRPPSAGELIDKGYRGTQYNSLAADERLHCIAAEAAAVEEAANHERNREWRENLERFWADPDTAPDARAEKPPTHQELYERGLRRLEEPAPADEPALNPPGTISRNLALPR